MKVRHLYIDSRYRTVGTDSDFSINLNETIELEEGARCWVAGVTSPNVFYTIEEDVNDGFFAANNFGFGDGRLRVQAGLRQLRRRGARRGATD